MLSSDSKQTHSVIAPAVSLLPVRHLLTTGAALSPVTSAASGLHFTERMVFISETCRQNEKHLLSYIKRAIVAHRQLK